MKVVFDNLANFLSISPNQTPGFCRLFAWSQLEFSAVPVSSHPVLSPISVYSVQCTCSHTGATLTRPCPRCPATVWPGVSSIPCISGPKGTTIPVTSVPNSQVDLLQVYPL